MPYSIECFLENHKNMEEVLLVLEVPLAQYSQAEKLPTFNKTPSPSPGAWQGSHCSANF